jgi:hypothetical protein
MRRSGFAGCPLAITAPDPAHAWAPFACPAEAACGRDSWPPPTAASTGAWPPRCRRPSTR